MKTLFGRAQIIFIDIHYFHCFAKKKKIINNRLYHDSQFTSHKNTICSRKKTTTTSSFTCGIIVKYPLSRYFTVYCLHLECQKKFQTFRFCHIHNWFFQNRNFLIHIFCIFVLVFHYPSEIGASVSCSMHTIAVNKCNVWNSNGEGSFYAHRSPFSYSQ